MRKRVFDLETMIRYGKETNQFPSEEEHHIRQLWMENDGEECFQDAYENWRVDGWFIDFNWTIEVDK